MAEDETEELRVRSFWSGTITFGLVSIPVELFPANRSQGVSLRMVTEDGTPLKRRYFCPKHDRELEWDEIVRGYEIEKDEYVVVTEEELEKLAPDRTRDIDLRRFVSAEDIDPIYFERAYYLTPGGNSTKAYRLLAATMEETGRAGIATFVMRGKEYLIAILAENGIMRAETLRFPDEVRTPADVGLPETVKASAATVKSIEKAIAGLREKKLDETELKDRSAEQLLKLVAKKEKAGTGVVDAPEVAAEPSEGVIDLMEVLKRSLEGKSGTKTISAGKTAGEAKSRKTSAKKATSEKSGAGKSSLSKKSPAKKTSAAKSSAGKSSAKKSPARKTAAKKSVTKKSVTKKSVTKKSAAKKMSKKSPKKSPAKKSAATNRKSA